MRGTVPVWPGVPAAAPETVPQPDAKTATVSFGREFGVAGLNQYVELKNIAI